jgi:predicted O-linked N-acetylglucosamine transferase (SPINDLY family)
MSIDVNALLQQAFLSIQKNELSEAEKILKKIVKLNIEHPDIYLQLGNVLGMKKNFSEALIYQLKAAKLEPNRVDVLMSLGTTYDEMKSYPEAIKVLQKAVSLDRGNYLILLGLGKTYFSNRQYQQSIDALESALKINLGDYRVWFNLGIAQDKLNQSEGAIHSYEQALQLNPDFPEGHVNKGNVLLKMQKFDLALDSFDQAIHIHPEFMNSYIAKAKTLIALNQLKESFETCQKALKIEVNNLELISIMGQILMKYFRYSEASDLFHQVVKSNPKDAKAHCDLANSLTHVNRHDEASQEYKIAYKLNPNLPGLIGSMTSTLLRLCNWVDFNQNIEAIQKSIASQEQDIDPFLTLSTLSAKEQYQAAQKWSSDLYKNGSKKIPSQNSKNKIRVGYFSSDFRTHAVARLTSGLFEFHDRERFEVLGFSSKGAKPDDPMRYRLQNAFDSFIDLENTPHLIRIDMIQSYDLDIAIDLGGHTKDSTIALLEYRVAPVQISYIGYPGTTGTSFIDYTIADPLLVPEESQQFYSEKIIYMPDTFQVNDSKREVPALKLTKEELGIPQDKFIFCCFNNSYKLNPAMFDVWMNILKRVPGSVLWLLGESLSSQNNLIKEAHLRGVKADSLIFATRCSYNEYLSRLQVADLFLDTIPFNAGTTASDALWVGLPVLTVLGDAYAGRMAGSLLNAVGLPELITHHLQDYENLAVEIASDPSKINALKQKLADQKLITPLFNTQLFTQNLEKAYLQIVQRARDGLPPDHIYVN